MGKEPDGEWEGVRVSYAAGNDLAAVGGNNLAAAAGNNLAVVVEQTRFLRQELVSELARAGWQVVGAAGDGRRGLEMALTHRPGLVVLDLALPDMPGTELIRRIKAEVPWCRVVVCSALVQSRWVQAAVEAGADDFVVKPLDEGRFRAAVGGAVGPVPAERAQRGG